MATCIRDGFCFYPKSPFADNTGGVVTLTKATPSTVAVSIRFHGHAYHQILENRHGFYFTRPNQKLLDEINMYTTYPLILTLALKLQLSNPHTGDTHNTHPYLYIYRYFTMYQLSFSAYMSTPWNHLRGQMVLPQYHNGYVTMDIPPTKIKQRGRFHKIPWSRISSNSRNQAWPLFQQAKPNLMK